MKRPQFRLSTLMAATLVVAMGLGWWLQLQLAKVEADRLRRELRQAKMDMRYVRMDYELAQEENYILEQTIRRLKSEREVAKTEFQRRLAEYRTRIDSMKQDSGLDADSPHASPFE